MYVSMCTCMYICTCTFLWTFEVLMTSLRQKDKHEEGRGAEGNGSKQRRKTERKKISPKNKKLAEEVEWHLLLLRLGRLLLLLFRRRRCFASSSLHRGVVSRGLVSRAERFSENCFTSSPLASAPPPSWYQGNTRYSFLRFCMCMLKYYNYTYSLIIFFINDRCTPFVLINSRSCYILNTYRLRYRLLLQILYASKACSAI